MRNEINSSKNIMSRVVVSAVLTVGLGAPAFADAVLVQAPVDKVFIPMGFDDNDKVEVIVSGKFTNSCYKIGPAEAFVNPLTKKVEIRAEAYYYPGAVCMQLVTPYIKSVELKGNLPAGQYDVAVMGSPQSKVSPLVIARSTRPEADDFMYAGVHSASLEQMDSEGEQVLILKGQHPFLLQGCAKFDQVKTYLSPSGVLVVQPITKVVEGSECAGSTVNNRFEEHIKMASPLAQGEYVVHVRTLNGGAVNQFVEIE